MKKQNTGVIYCITNKINGKKYIGQTIEPKVRKRKHFSGTTDAPLLKRAIEKYGADNFEWCILEDNISYDKLDIREIHYIKHHNTLKPNGYNLTKGGHGTRGYTLSEARKRKISEAGQKRKQLPETREKIGNAHRGRKYSEERKRQMSETTRQQLQQNPERRKQFSQARKGLEPWNKGKTDIYSQETLEKMSKGAKKRFQNPEEREKASQAAKIRFQDHRRTSETK